MTQQQKEDRAIEALIALTLHHAPVTEEEVAEYMSRPVKLSAEDELALEKASEKLFKKIHERRI